MEKDLAGKSNLEGDKKTLDSFLPNPFSSSGTLDQFTKSGMTLGQGINIVQEIWRKPLLLIVTAVLVNLGDLSWWLYLLAVICIFTALFLNIKAFKKLRRLQADNTGAVVLAPFIITRRAQIITAALNTPVNLIILLALIKIFIQQSNYDISATLEGGALWLAALLVIIVSGINYLVGAIEVRGYDKAGNITDTGQALQMMEVVKNKIQLAKFLLAMPFILIILGATIYLIVQNGPPAQGSSAGGLIALGAMVIGVIAFPFLYIISTRRMASVNLQPGVVTPPTPQANTETPTVQNDSLSPPAPLPASSNGETIVEKIFGIMPNYGGIQGVQFMGKGEMRYPENSLIITDKRLILIQVPMPGGNNIIGDVDYQSNNFYFNRGQLHDNGEALLASQNIDQVITSNPKNFVIDLADVQEFILSRNNIKINTTTADKYSYIFMDKVYNDRLAAVLPNLLGARFIAK